MDSSVVTATAVMYTDHSQDDLLIAWGLALLSNEFEIADPQLADRALALAVAAAGHHGLTPSEAILQVEHSATVTR